MVGGRPGRVVQVVAGAVAGAYAVAGWLVVNAEGFVQFGEEGVFGERFLDEVGSGFQDALRAEQTLGVAGHEYHPGGGLQDADLVGEFLSLDTGHDDVGEQHVNVLQLAGQDVQCFVTAGDGDHVVAAAVQDPAGDLAHGRFVFHDQDRLAVAVRGVSARRGVEGYVLLGDGQQRREAGAQARFGVDPHVASRLGDDPVHGGQTQAGALAFGLGGEERLETRSRTSLGIPVPVSLTFSAT